MAIRILAIEASTEACSVALSIGHQQLSRYVLAPQQHARLILPMCQELLQEADIRPAQLSAVAFGRGPGSFTGIRIATTVAQGIAIAHDLPVIGVSSLQIIAQIAFDLYQKTQVFSGIDARMNEIYLGQYHFNSATGLMTLQATEMLISMMELQKSEHYFYAGSAFQQDNIIFPSAAALMPKALYNFHQKKLLTPENAQPVYLRHKVV